MVSTDVAFLISIYKIRCKKILKTLQPHKPTSNLTITIITTTMVIAMISNSVTAIPAMTPGSVTSFDDDCVLIISVIL